MSDPHAPADPRALTRLPYGTPSGASPASTARPDTQHPVAAPVPLALGCSGTVRSPGSVFWLCWATLGVYALFLHYRLNDELRRFNPGVQVRPWLAVAAFLVPFGGVVSALHTSERIRRTQAAVGLPIDCSAGQTLMLILVGASFAFQQAKLNQVWTLVGTR